MQMSYPKQIIYNINYLKVLKDFFINTETSEFLNNFKNIANIEDKEVLLLGRARAGIFLAVKNSVKSKKNNLVFLSSYTIPEVIDLVIHAGGKPYFIDFNKDSTYFDISSLQSKMKLKPAAIIITHYNVNQISYEKISEIVKQNDSILIEDSALSISGKSKNININTLSDYSIFSFSSFKLLNFFYGGAIVYDKKFKTEINNETRNWERLSLKDYLPQLVRTIFFDFITSKYLFSNLTIKYLKHKYLNKNQSDFIEKKLKIEKTLINKNYFSHPTKLMAKELNRKLNKYKNDKSHRIKISKIYHKYLKSISVNKGDELLENIEKSDNFNYLIKCQNEEHRDGLKKKLLVNNYDVGKIFYENCHLLERFSKFEGVSDNITDLSNKILILPTHYLISENYAKSLSHAIIKDY
jgi:perosamine synthetase